MTPSAGSDSGGMVVSIVFLLAASYEILYLLHRLGRQFG